MSILVAIQVALDFIVSFSWVLRLSSMVPCVLQFYFCWVIIVNDDGVN